MVLGRLDPLSGVPRTGCVLPGQTDHFTIAVSRLACTAIRVRLRRSGGDPLLMSRRGEPPRVPRRDMSSGVTWPRSANGKCTVKRWVGWSDGKGNSGELEKARGRDDEAEEVLEVAEVAKRLESQLNASFLGAGYVRRGIKYLLRARVLEEVGGVRRVRTLWEASVRLAEV